MANKRPRQGQSKWRLIQHKGSDGLVELVEVVQCFVTNVMQRTSNGKTYYNVCYRTPYGDEVAGYWTSRLGWMRYYDSFGRAMREAKAIIRTTDILRNTEYIKGWNEADSIA